MEFADDGDLYQKIVEKKKNSTHFDETFIWKVLIQVTRGLKTLHNLNIFHRDLKVCFFLFRVQMSLSIKRAKLSLET